MRLIFINLSLDQNYDSNDELKNVFPLQVSTSEYLTHCYQELGIFLTENESDTVITFNHLDESYLHFLEDKGIRFTHKTHQAPPRHFSDWNFNEIESFKNYAFAGVSDFEAQIDPSLQKDLEKIKSLNQKSFLVDHRNELCVNLPDSQVCSLSELNESILKNFGLPLYLKYNHSSGGGGIFLIEKENDLNWKLFKRIKENVSPHSKWIIQKSIGGATHFSICGHTENKDFDLFQVDYDKNQNSHTHHYITEHEYENNFLKVQRHLCSLNYSGPFGFDFMVKEGQFIGPIDLNVRMTKTHFLAIIRNRYIHSDHCQFYKIRERGIPFNNFDHFWTQVKHLGIFPYIVGPVLKQGERDNLPRTLEIHFALKSEDELIIKEVHNILRSQNEA